MWTLYDHARFTARPSSFARGGGDERRGPVALVVRQMQALPVAYGLDTWDDAFRMTLGHSRRTQPGASHTKETMQAIALTRREAEARLDAVARAFPPRPKMCIEKSQSVSLERFLVPSWAAVGERWR